MKKWYLSRTLWANFLMFLGSTILTISGKDILSLDAQAGIIAGVNVILRLITKEELVG